MFKRNQQPYQRQPWAQQQYGNSSGGGYSDDITKSNEASYKVSRENDAIDSKYGFDRVKDGNERTGFLINIHSTEVLDADRRLVSALDLYFLTMNASRFKVSVIYQPYFLVLPQQHQLHEVMTFLQRKFGGQAAKIEAVVKEDLDKPNHIIGLKQNMIKMSFTNTNMMNKVRLEINRVVKKNKEREKTNTFYMKLLSTTLAGSSNNEQNPDFMDFIMDIREHDVPYHVRVSIDLQIFCGLWYNIKCLGSTERPLITQRPDIIERPDPIVLAYDIETTKLPLKFPDAQSDQIMMISYMIDGQGYLITNREIVSCNVNDFEYTPKPEFEGNFIVFNEPNEVALIQKFFDHILDIRPHIIVSYNGDFFDWPFLETRAAIYDIDMKREIGFVKNREGNYLSRPCMHMDCLCWVKRDSYLPVGSQGLKAVAKAKLRYDPVELDPEEMCKKAVEHPQELASYSVSDAVATYYLYMKYIHPFIFALATIIPMEPDEVLRKGSGTLCESLLMKEAFHVNIVFPNKEQAELNKMTEDGHVLDTETYVGGHVEALESGVFRADLPYRFRLDCEMITKLQNEVSHVLKHSLEVEENIPLSEVQNLDDVIKQIQDALQALHDNPVRMEKPVIYHLDVGAMYPNIILTNRLQPSAMVTEQDCAACDFNKPDAKCKRKMDWLWRGEMLPATRSEFQRIQQQLETEKFPPLYPDGPTRAFHELSREDSAAFEKKRLTDYCRKAYKKTKVTKLETKTSTICQMENSFYVDTVRAFRDRRYEYKGMTKVAKADVVKAVKSGDAGEIKAAKGREVLFDSLQLAHKCILNSFYGYVMRRGARWHSMQMGGIVCLTGSNIITKAREVIEKVGRPLELDTDGIWCILPGTFPQDFEVLTNLPKKSKITVSYPNAVLNTMVKDHFTNDQYHKLEKSAGENGELPEYSIHQENSIFFEVDGPYLAMVLPAAKEEGKKLKKRYAVFNFDGSLAELKGFEIKRRGELQLIKIFQSQVFNAFLQGNTLEKCYECVAKVANYWLDVLFSKGANMPDSELFELISENRSMSRKLEDYGVQKSTSISTAKRLAEFLGDQMVKDAGLACKYIISRKPEGAPVTERAIPLAIFQSESAVRRHHLRRWLKDSSIDGDVDIRDILDWNYYIERIGGAIQKIITIPAALQGISNPVPRVQHPDWLHKKMLEKNDVFKQRRINDMFKAKPIRDIEDTVGSSSTAGGIPIVTTKRKRTRTECEEENQQQQPKTWREALGNPPEIGTTKEELIEWIKFQKKKWRWQIESRKKFRSDVGNKRGRHDVPLMEVPAQRGPISSLGGFLKRTQRNLIELPWQIIQIVAIDQDGNFNVWALIGDELQKLKLVVPRIFYVNQRTLAPLCDDLTSDVTWKKVNRTLPRSRPTYNLYQYNVPEHVFRDNQLGMLVDLAAPDIEGIYETQLSLEFRALIQLGCTCAVQRSEAKKIASIPSGHGQGDTFSLHQLEQRSQIHQPYLKDAEKLRRIFLYQHTIPSGKKSLWGLFLTPMKKAIIIVHDSVRNNQMPTMKNLYQIERQALIADNDDDESEKLPPNDISFDVHVEIDIKQVYRHIQKALSAYKQERRGPTILCIQSATAINQLNVAIPTLLDFPQTKFHITDDASLLVGLEWQKNGVKSMIRHYLNHQRVLDLMLEQCRYFHLPIGNMTSNTVLFGADLFYARHLQKNNFVLWWSPNCRPDLGGTETDDNTLLSEFDDNKIIQQCKSGFFPNVCVELTIDSLAVSSLLQSHRIQEMEGANSAITFDTIPQASLDDMITNPNLLQMLPSYDETALCSAAFRIMRSMVGGWMREVSVNRNVYSDFQIVHFYRWIRSSTSYLYDPALRRSLNTLMKKLFLQLISEFKNLGVDIIYADFTKIIINSGKKSVIDGISYADYICQSIRGKELFHSVHLSYQQCWNFLLWMDSFNYSGFRGKLPKELRNDEDEEEVEETEDVNEEDELDMNWNICENLPQEGETSRRLEAFLKMYINELAKGEEASKTLKNLSHHAFETVLKLYQTTGRQSEGPATEFIKALCKILSVDPSINDELDSLRKNMLRLVGLGEFSDKAVWKDPGKSYVLSEMICQACYHCRDVDLLRDKHRAIKDGNPVWLCSQCLMNYDNDEIENRLIDAINRRLMSYTLQDLQCVRCKEIKQDNIIENCSCAGRFTTLIKPEEIRNLIKTFNHVADTYSMVLLKEHTDSLINNI
ncbi:CLUMA_CG008185, isoform A [Clunio marinus]|uniref:DNA polymerase epsilon catalytic subunit n=1 Tax=Clunio marinus TaxID=568069 RepID=A0A1J1I324_9DIPT|nr:CLUMA_CG008185, isoform A [Clunio marinus]